MAAAAEEQSNHPLAHAVIDHARSLGLTWQPAQNLQIYPGRGLAPPSKPGMPARQRNAVSGVLCPFTQHVEQPVHKPQPGVTRLWMALENAAVGHFDARDALRPDAAEAVAELRSFASGKNGPARADAHRGHPRPLPHPSPSRPESPKSKPVWTPRESWPAFAKLQQSGLRVAMWATASTTPPRWPRPTPAFAMGSGAGPWPRKQATLLLLRAQPSAIPEALGLARATLRIMRQNLAWAAAYNVLAFRWPPGCSIPRFICS